MKSRWSAIFGVVPVEPLPGELNLFEDAARALDVPRAVADHVVVLRHRLDVPVRLVVAEERRREVEHELKEPDAVGEEPVPEPVLNVKRQLRDTLQTCLVLTTARPAVSAKSHQSGPSRHRPSYRLAGYKKLRLFSYPAFSSLFVRLNMS